MNNISKVVIGIKKELSNDLESFLSGMYYTKDVMPTGDYFSFDYEDWANCDDPWPSALMTYLFSVVGMDNYGFIRLGDEPDDSEIHGDINAFNIKFNREVLY